MTINKFPISWLIEKVGIDYWNSDVAPLLENIGEFLDVGGYIAGGFWRRALRGTIKQDLKSVKFYSCTIFGFDNTLVNGVALSPLYGAAFICDVDIWFRSEEIFQGIFQKLLADGKISSEKIEQALKDPKYKTAVSLYRNETKIQLINHDHGAPEKIIADFDMANCQIASDLNHVWVSDDFLKYEMGSERWVVPLKKNSKRWLWRPCKYLVSDLGYKGILNTELLMEAAAEEVCEQKLLSENNAFINAALSDARFPMDVVVLRCVMESYLIREFVKLRKDGLPSLPPAADDILPAVEVCF